MNMETRFNPVENRRRQQAPFKIQLLRSCITESQSGLYGVTEPPVPLAGGYAYKSIITGNRP